MKRVLISNEKIVAWKRFLCRVFCLHPPTRPLHQYSFFSEKRKITPLTDFWWKEAENLKPFSFRKFCMQKPSRILCSTAQNFNSSRRSKKGLFNKRTKTHLEGNFLSTFSFPFIFLFRWQSLRFFDYHRKKIASPLKLFFRAF